jgi:hypothetical protein
MNRSRLFGRPEDYHSKPDLKKELFLEHKEIIYIGSGVALTMNAGL